MREMVEEMVTGIISSGACIGSSMVDDSSIKP